jgi:hypothetical protein
MRTIRQLQGRIQAVSVHRGPGFVNLLLCVVFGVLLTIETARQGVFFFS